MVDRYRRWNEEVVLMYELNWETYESVFDKVILVQFFYIIWWSFRIMHKSVILVSNKGMKLWSEKTKNWFVLPR